jgi:hypothetical protein
VRQMKHRSIVGWLFILVFLLACGIPSSPAAPVLPEAQSMDSLGTMIVETAAAAQTQTAAALPTSTSTATPTRTATVTPTPTPTFLFILVTDTSTPLPETETPFVSIPGSGGSSGGDEEEDGETEKPLFTGKPWTCRGIGKTPPNYASIEPGKRFTVVWTLLNTGTKPWTVNTIDFVYKSGFRHENTKIQDLKGNIGPGGQITVSADFIAPKKPGEYNTYFTLQVGKQQFCGMRNAFIVYGEE